MLTELELKKLKRAELIGIISEVTAENDDLREQLRQSQELLVDKRITVEKTGSLAEAAVQLSGIFEAAEKACAIYSESIRKKSEEQEAYSVQKKKETEELCAKMIKEAKEESQKYWDDVNAKIEKIIAQYKGLKDFLNDPKSDLVH